MAEFTISPRQVRRSAGTLGNCSGRMSSCQNRIGNVIRSISAYSSIAGTKKVLSSLQNQAGNYSRSFVNMQTALNSCVTAYETAERSNAGKSVSVWALGFQNQLDRNSPGWKFLDSETTSGWGKKEWEGYLLRYQGDEKAQEYILGAAASAGVSLIAPKYKDKDSIYELKRGEDRFGKKLYEDKWVRDKDGQYSFADMTKYASKKGTIAELKGELKGEVSLWGKSGGNENANYEVVVGRAEAHSSISGGLYGYDKYGKKVLAPAIGAAAGASVCMMNAKGELKTGNDLFGAGANGEVSVGKASAEGELSAVLFGEKGPQLKASASAEAIAAEAKGSASINVAGIQGSVNGSVNFGVGAHADIGVVDGKIKCDIGASLGVGVSIGFEVDTKPLVDTIVSGAKAIWNGMFGWM